MNLKALLRNLNKDNFGSLYTFFICYKAKGTKIMKRKTKRKLHCTESGSHRVHRPQWGGPGG